MSFVKPALITLSLALTGCSDITGDLFPSSRDERTDVDASQAGPRVGQQAPDFSALTSQGDSIRLSNELTQPGTKAVVLYFAMWCPVCNSHMDHMVQNILPAFPDARFYAVDYLSGSVEDVRSNVVANGYANVPISVLADLEDAILNAYKGTMGTTIVIDGTGIIRMNEDYKDGAKLRNILEGLP